MKKIIAALTALMLCGTILTACGAKTADDTEVTVSETTTAAETTAAETTAAETTAAETTAEATTEATEAETTAAAESAPADNGEMTDEMKATLEILDKEAPVYANYLRESMKFPISNTFEYDMEVDGETQHVVLTSAIASATKLAVNTKTGDESMNIILNGSDYYIVVPSEKSAMYMTIPNDGVEDMADSLEESMMPKFDASKATFEKGEGEVNGETLPYEKVTTEDGEVFLFYYEEGSLDIKYLCGDDIVMKMVEFTHDVDDSLFEVPADYELIDLAEAFGSLVEEE